MPSKIIAVSGNENANAAEGRGGRLSPTHLTALREAASPLGFDDIGANAVAKRASHALWKRGFIRWGWVKHEGRELHKLVATPAGREALSREKADG
ncbi:hypothetical protein SAMN05192568_106118 [Methylobacterium pseudosasicola]|uniref:Uncharacterized protein n=1 Tax=Methylobacterium pseudosasicola TaxID=582667 RepID=A0A1I4U0V6_9HYPH|nr:hypothetical protein SAMN05192568_106118 [Methylobacterium pseudosasicola]